MGGQNAKPEVPPEILREEIEALMIKSTCSQEMERALNREIEVMLFSLDPNTRLPPSSLAAFNRGVLNPKGEDEAKAVILDRINEFELAKEVDARFFDPNLFSVLGCLYGNFLTVDKRFFAATTSTKNYFQVTDNLSIGQWGLVLRSKNGGSEMSFIIKTQTNPNESDLSIHEAFIAVYCTNPLRSFCPNFSYLYGGFTCGKPDGINAKICNGQVQVPYTVYENVPGSGFGTFLKNLPKSLDMAIRPRHNPLTPNQPAVFPAIEPSYLIILSTLLQMFLALKIAHAKAYQFSHKDLHSENIILRPLKSTAILKYDSHHFIVEDAIVKLKQKRGEIPPTQEPTGVRSVYYVRADYVATVIDYDMAEVYMPYLKNDGNYEIRRHGIRDRDPVDGIVSDDPTVSHIRDLAKLLGFSTIRVLEKEVNVEFKELMCDLYIDTIRPYYTILQSNPGAKRQLSLQEKVNLVVRDNNSRFMLTRSQIQAIRDGIITFDRFLANFIRLVPHHYNWMIAVRKDLDPHFDNVFEDQLRQKTGLTILGCNDECPGEVQTYQTLTAINPQAETDEVRAATLTNPAALAYQVITAYLSDLHFRQSPVKIPDPRQQLAFGGFPSSIEYRQITAQKLKALTQLATPDTLRSIDAMIQTQADVLDRMIGSIRLPDPQQFPRDPNTAWEGIGSYRTAINTLFTMVKKMREIIVLHNASVILNSPFAIASRRVASVINRKMVEFLHRVVYPWRDSIYRVSKTHGFGSLQVDMTVVISTKLPDVVIFDPIF